MRPLRPGVSGKNTEKIGEDITMRFIQIGFLLFVASYTTGCISTLKQKSQSEALMCMTARFYSGPLRSSSDVALIMKGWGDSHLASFDAHPIELGFFCGFSYHGRPQILEVLPGRHVINLFYESSGTMMNTKSSGNLTLNIYVKPGHVYVYYPEFPTRRTWKPVFVDLDELSMAPPGPEYTNRISLLKESASKYFLGERPIFTGQTQKK